ncbi:unnamed protein product [Dibothriocephalus latus]|uniref:Annexin n=1 Tax=Dibothriocephalus latus TaxID=60516 RepID=A0A3P7MHP7_DIBLA|nr:unnamed protein product [Dibothriocephalus latus]
MSGPTSDIYTKLHSELGGEFRKVVLMSFRDKAHINALALFNAMAGAGTKDRVVVQTICACDNKEIEDLKKAYEDSKSIFAHMPVCEKGACSALVFGQREANTAKATVVADCEALYAAGEGTSGTDESVFVRILANRSHRHIREMNKDYSAATGHDLLKAIKKETSGNFKDALEIVGKFRITSCCLS